MNEEIWEKTKSFKSQITGVLDKCLKPLTVLREKYTKLEILIII